MTISLPSYSPPFTWHNKSVALDTPVNALHLTQEATALAGFATAIGTAAGSYVDSNSLSSQSTSAQSLAGSLTVAPQKKISLSASGVDNGSVTRLIELHASTIVDRPWMSWFDHNSRHVTSTGAHDTLNVSEGGTQLKQFEIKTVADAGSSNPTELRTRFAVQYDVQRGTWGFNFIDNFEVNQGENPILTYPTFGIVPAGVRVRLAPQDTFSVSNFVAAQFMAEVDASDNVIGFLDVNVPYQSGGSLFPGNKTATLDIFRNTNTSSSSSPQLAIKKGDGSNTNALVFTAKSGLLELPLAVSGTTGIKLGGDTVATLYRSAADIVKTDGSLVGAKGVGTKVKAGTPVDGDYTTPLDGLLVVDSSANKIWARVGGTWKGVVIA